MQSAEIDLLLSGVLKSSNVAAGHWRNATAVLGFSICSLSRCCFPDWFGLVSARRKYTVSEIEHKEDELRGELYRIAVN